MTTLFQSSHTSIKRSALLILLITVACQSAGSPGQPVSQPAASQPVVQVAPSATPLLASPSPASHNPLRSTSGPWLVYRKPKPDELVLINQDGSAFEAEPAPACSAGLPLVIGTDPLDRTAILGTDIYLIQPVRDERTLIYSDWPPCDSAFTGDAQAGLLARVERATTSAIPNLVIYEIPGGRVRASLPLAKCATGVQCDFSSRKGWEIRWSPNGRYLAFPAMWTGPSTDLYVYDSQDGSTRQLTSGPDDIGQLAWSPDGSTILMGEILAAPGNAYPNTTSVWAVSVASNAIQQLYSLDQPAPQAVLGWIDNQKVVVYEGTSLNDPQHLPAGNLRMIDLGTGRIQPTFDGSFSRASLDPASQTIVLFGRHNGAQYQQGTYLLSIGAFTVHFLGTFSTHWDNQAKLYVTDTACTQNTKLSLAFDNSGKTQCLSLPDPIEDQSSPDGKWLVRSSFGLDLVPADKSAVPITTDLPTQVIWCPDSSCFFYVAKQALYHVSLPDHLVQRVDAQLNTDQLAYQWLK